MLTAHLNDRLDACLPDDARFAIAFSGGGDSTALLHALKDHPQKGPVFIVDHGLRPGSAKEADMAKAFAATCGYDAKVLKWKHNSPKSGIQEKARQARYGLLGEACRHAGIKYLITAHNEDDQAETLLMRYDRKTDWRGAAGMAEMTYGAVWPELALVNIVRPLLDASRQQLRDYNRYHHLNWIDDPSNENRDFTRIRARDYLRTNKVVAEDLLATAQALRLGRATECRQLRQQLAKAQFGKAGEITFQTIPQTELLRMALLCAGGGSAAGDRQRLRDLNAKLRAGKIQSFTFSGAQAVMTKSGLVISRDPVAVTGRKDGGLKPRAIPLALTLLPQIWDGRFAITAKQTRFEVHPRHQLKLPRTPRLDEYIQSLPRSVRQTAPVIVQDGQAFAPSEVDNVALVSLIRPRLDTMLEVKLH